MRSAWRDVTSPDWSTELVALARPGNVRPNFLVPPRPLTPPLGSTGQHQVPAQKLSGRSLPQIILYVSNSRLVVDMKISSSDGLIKLTRSRQSYDLSMSGWLVHIFLDFLFNFSMHRVLVLVASS